MSPVKTDLASDFVNAAFEGETQRVSLLLTSRVDINSRVGPGLTAWEAAKIKGHADVLDQLARRGANTNAVIPKPEAVLDWYVRQKIGPKSPGLALAVVREGNVVF